MKINLYGVFYRNHGRLSGPYLSAVTTNKKNLTDVAGECRLVVKARPIVRKVVSWKQS